MIMVRYVTFYTFFLFDALCRVWQSLTFEAVIVYQLLWLWFALGAFVSRFVCLMGAPRRRRNVQYHEKPIDDYVLLSTMIYVYKKTTFALQLLFVFCGCVLNILVLSFVILLLSIVIITFLKLKIKRMV